MKTILELGQLDAVVAYKHESVSKGLPYVTLPKEINLGDNLFSNFYKKSDYTSESNKKTIYGEPMYFSITIPQTVNDMKGAISFVNFLLSNNGSQILENQGLDSIDILFEGDINKIPLHIKTWFQSNIF